ncbi:hypothetical protein A3J90_07950 [candidate division WOR-1 bacterium RIFOXYC2_FULL_37_10]|uniref:Uncharacterized protein n=1 Tax=candidate division WOR-1 bacterium RIFOXYB2_FULL_37_13 TaxID=1802579 RepID=A0A1F4SPP6_UNCSA|nr:MAG: hypothetical protein A2246_00425 [candidate division WOR-1 bacterium RIFOXYA2_FULL_37_7]OGC22380.1 MAG: hypothetical protein A2310_01815 [candidate division WOR-1 bacterium RIFOXYB2_FULL_37_13]OGC35216.1 MAG: hypothetical protein A3J90_07950 [candidate division WOR-1 bacterium RIFOXYC2_FULL_37_10]
MKLNEYEREDLKRIISLKEPRPCSRHPKNQTTGRRVIKIGTVDNLEIYACIILKGMWNMKVRFDQTLGVRQKLPGIVLAMPSNARDSSFGNLEALPAFGLCKPSDKIFREIISSDPEMHFFY